MRSVKDIQIDVAIWSTRNFGHQQSKVDPDLFLGSLAPLLGIGEELGEYFEEGKLEDSLDALADMGVYLCDYAAREGFTLPDMVEAYNSIPQEEHSMDAVAGLAIYLGRLFNCTLKRHQGIKGMDNRDAYVEKRDAAVRGLLTCLDRCVAEEHPEAGRERDFTELLDETYQNIVKKRNWKEDPETGGGHNHHS